MCSNVLECTINEKCCSVDGICPLFSSPPGEFDSSRVLIPGNLRSKAKKMLMPGGQRGEGGGGGGRGAAGIDWYINPGILQNFYLFFFFFFLLKNVRIYFPYLVCFLQKTIARFLEEQKKSKPWTQADHPHVFSYFLRRLGTRSYSYHGHLSQYMCICTISVSVKSRGAYTHKSILEIRICKGMYRKTRKNGENAHKLPFKCTYLMRYLCVLLLLFPALKTSF